MALTAQEAITRFKESEVRTHTLVNDPNDVGFYTTDTNPAKQVETYPHFIKRITGTVNGVVGQAQAEADRAEAAAQNARQTVDGVLENISAAGIAEVERVGQEGKAWVEAACECAQTACECADEAWRAVGAIPGAEAMQYTINALNIVDGVLTWSQGRAGAVMRSSDYDWCSGPEPAAVYYTLNNQGEVVRHIPVAPPAIGG